jgi:hypothetical protein
MAADFLNAEAGSEQAPTSMFRLEKKHHCAGVFAAVEQPSVGVFVFEEVGNDDGSPGRLHSFADMPSFSAAMLTGKNFLFGGAPRGPRSPQTSSTRICT